MDKKIFQFIKTHYLASGFLLLGLITALSGDRQTPLEKMDGKFDLAKSADTFIPKGHVLVPLEIANADSLTSLLGEVGGVIDLYLATNDKQKGGLKVGSKLKILRAPLNPQQYAVLVKDSESPRLLSYSGPFIAVVQNPEAAGTEVSAGGPQKIKIDYQN